MLGNRGRPARPTPPSRILLVILVLLGAASSGPHSASGAWAATVALRLASPQNGVMLAPGAAVEWSVEAQASSDDNAGLALVVFDLVQSDANPGSLDLPPAREVPAGMESFSRPLGISNPGEGGLATGYVGLQRGTPGARNLVEIGGAQNTSGQPGLLLGRSTAVAARVGQGTPVVVARGSFNAPAAPGLYSFSIRDGLANTLVDIGEAPAPSPVQPAGITLQPASFSFTVEDAAHCALGCFLRGDCNGDGSATGSVTDAVFLLQFNFVGGRVPPCLAACDVNGDGSVTGSVTDAVVLLQFNFLGGLPPPAPFPSCAESTRPSDARLGCERNQEVCP